MQRFKGMIACPQTLEKHQLIADCIKKNLVLLDGLYKWDIDRI